MHSFSNDISNTGAITAWKIQPDNKQLIFQTEIHDNVTSMRQYVED